MTTFYFGIQPTGFALPAGAYWFIPTTPYIEFVGDQWIDQQMLGSIQTSTGTSLYSFYDTPAEAIAPNTWNLSAGSNYIFLRWCLSDSHTTDAFGIRTADAKTTFEGHTFNLGLGNDAFILSDEVYYDSPLIRVYGANYGAYSYNSQSDAILDGGYSFTVNAGAGQDTIDISLEFGDYYCEKTAISTGVFTKTLISPRVVINGEAGDDNIRVDGVALLGVCRKTA